MVWKPIAQLRNGKPDFNPCFSRSRIKLEKWIKNDINALNENADLLISSIVNEKGVIVSQGQKIYVICGDTWHIAVECMLSQEEINQVHDYGQFQNNPRLFNLKNNQGGNYNNSVNYNNCQGNFQSQNQPRQLQQSNFKREVGTSKNEESNSNKFDKIMEFITQIYQKDNTNSKSIAAIEK